MNNFNIITTTPYIIIHRYTSPTYVSTSTSATVSDMGRPYLMGEVRYNHACNNLEWFTGYRWEVVSATNIQIGISQDCVDILEWARKKINEEKQYISHCDDPIMKDLLEQKRQLDSKIKMTSILLNEVSSL